MEPNTIIAAISAITALVALGFTSAQWKKINKKLILVTESENISEILPAWYTARMSNDMWCFGIRTIDGSVTVIENIDGMTEDGKWIDATLHTAESSAIDNPPSNYVFAISEQRKSTSIRVDSIVSAQDLRTS